MKPLSLQKLIPPPSLRTRLVQRREYAVQAPGAAPLQVFNRHVKRIQRERAASDIGHSRRVDYLRDEVAARLCERLLVWKFYTHSLLPLMKYY